MHAVFCIWAQLLLYFLFNQKSEPPQLTLFDAEELSSPRTFPVSSAPSSPRRTGATCFLQQTRAWSGAASYHLSNVSVLVTLRFTYADIKFIFSPHWNVCVDILSNSFCCSSFGSRTRSCNKIYQRDSRSHLWSEESWQQIPNSGDCGEDDLKL